MSVGQRESLPGTESPVRKSKADKVMGSGTLFLKRLEKGFELHKDFAQRKHNKVIHEEDEQDKKEIMSKSPSITKKRDYKIQRTQKEGIHITRNDITS